MFAAMRSVPILHEDERVLVVDKPAGLLSVPDRAAGARSVPELLAAEGVRVLPVHRLDREVSGVLLLARDEEALVLLQDLFRAHAVEKLYWGMASGNLEPPAGQLAFPILDEPGGARVSVHGKPARTRYRKMIGRELQSVNVPDRDVGLGEASPDEVHGGGALIDAVNVLLREEPRLVQVTKEHPLAAAEFHKAVLRGEDPGQIREQKPIPGWPSGLDNLVMFVVPVGFFRLCHGTRLSSENFKCNRDTAGLRGGLAFRFSHKRSARRVSSRAGSGDRQSRPAVPTGSSAAPG
jgi:hypothetical protein